MIIYSAWLQGRKNAPRTVQKIFDLWEQLNPEHSLHIVEQEEADAILAELRVRQTRITPQVTTDLVRMALLVKTGGVWVDATLLPTRPLSDWLTVDLTAAGFFAFRSTGDKNLQLQNWFLYSAADNHLMSGWLDIYADYFRSRRIFPTWKRAIYHLRILDYVMYMLALKRRDTIWFADPVCGRSCLFYPYAVVNYNFSYLIFKKPELAEIWDNVPFRTAWLPSSIGYMAKDPETTDQAFLLSATEALATSPVHKLNSRDPRFERLIDSYFEKAHLSVTVGVS
ncbi:hypothetical protein GC209_19775 [bacterium]|nr:hypothetical protein [bacterium]